MTILATLCGAQNWVDIASWGQAKAASLAEFLELTHGIPSHDTFGRVFAVLDPASLQQAFVAWMQALADLSQDPVARDGKTIRWSLDSADAKGPIHVVNAWAAANEPALAQVNVDAKTNQITALPELLCMLNRAGAVVTLDAMGCQVEIARQIQEQGADHVLSVKANQPVAVGYDEQVDGGHGCIETHQVWSTAALEGVGACERWPGLSSLVLVESILPLGVEENVERRDYSSSLPGTTDNEARRLNRMMRAHWEIENRVHWVLDVAMGEDANRARKGEGAQNLALMRKLALKLLHQEQSVTLGIAAKQKQAGWDHDYLLKILSQMA